MSPMKRRDYLKAMGLGAVSLTMQLYGCATEKSAGKPPNIVLVITDDQGYGDLACHGNQIIKTPNIDKLYAKSTRLTNFHVGPTCAPTRAALMTGHYCNRTGVWHTVMGRSLLRKDEVTVADVFKSGGYKTGIFGKWHLGDNYPFRPQDRGFDEVMIHGGGGVGQMPDYWDNDYFDDTYLHNGTPEKFTGYCTDVWFEGAMKFIETNKEKPFFCYLTTNSPHSPYHVPEKYSSLYAGKGIPDERARFYGMITNIDDNIALLVEKLETLGIADNTIFIYMTDNGTSSGVNVDRDGFPADNGFNAGMRGKKGSEYDGGHRVPCFIHWPAGGFDIGRDIDLLTAHIDLLPTLIEMCGLEKPERVKLDGASIMPLLKGKGEDWPDRILVTDSQRIEHPEKWRKSATMTNRWRLINGRELYDINADPGQKNNIADKHAEVVAKLRRAYEDWWEDVSQRFDEYCETIIGSDSENPVRLICHDWHNVELPPGKKPPMRDGKPVEINPPWNQMHIRNGMQSNGIWAVEIERDGTYEFSLRRWPEEADKPLNASLPGGAAVPGGGPKPPGKAINVKKARIRIAGIDEEKKVTGNETAVKFTLQLKSGKTTLKTWLTGNSGEFHGAYYVYVKRL